MADKKRILVVEDEEKIASFMKIELNFEGYNTDVAYDGREALSKIETNEYDLLILDIMLPSLSGIEVLRRVRKSSDVPVIFLSAKDDLTTKVMGLDLGACDYVTKPFEIEELLARIRVATREETPRQAMDMSFEDLYIDVESRVVQKDGKKVKLTKNEFIILSLLIKNKKKIVTREEITSALWGKHFSGESGAIDVYINHLRTKLDTEFNKKIIKTIRGTGYTLKDDKID